MFCPICKCDSEMAYSVLSHGFVCLEEECGFELEVDLTMAGAILAPVPELVCA